MVFYIVRNSPSAYLEGNVASAELIVGLEEVFEAREPHAALLRNLVLVVQAVVGERRQGCASEDAHSFERRVEHLEDANVAEVDVLLNVDQVVRVTCNEIHRR